MDLSLIDKNTLQIVRNVVGSDTYKVNRFKVFQEEWKIPINLLLTLSDGEAKDLFQQIKQLLSEEIRWLVVILSPEYHDLKERILSLGFTHYFIRKNFHLNLSDFSMEAPSIPNIIISNPKLNLNDPSDLQILEQIYLTEWKSDFKVREFNRFDKDITQFEEFLNRFISNNADLKSLHIAKYGGIVVGLSYAWIENKAAGIFFTGTHPNYLGKGIATALKIYLANHLKERGIHRLTTNNRASNTGILRTNDKLGFQHDFDEIFLHLRLMD